MRTERILRCVGRILRVTVLILITVPLIGNIYIAAAKNIFDRKDPSFFGFSASVVLTGSMSGTIEPNDLILTHKQDQYTVGDIITFDSGGTSVTHRIIGTDDAGYRTKGDANNTADGTSVGQESVIGKVILVIPGVGAALGFIRTPLGVICFLGLTVLIVELPNIVNYLKKNRDEQ